MKGSRFASLGGENDIEDCESSSRKRCLWLCLAGFVGNVSHEIFALSEGSGEENETRQPVCLGWIRLTNQSGHDVFGLGAYVRDLVTWQW